MRIAALLAVLAAAVIPARSQNSGQFHLQQGGWTFDAIASPDKDGTPAVQFTARRPDGTERRFLLGYLNRSIERVIVVGETVIVVGQTSVCDLVNVLSMIDGTVRDQFLASVAMPSPSGRRLAFQKFFPSNDPISASIYLVYEVGAPRIANRMNNLIVERCDECAGWAFYPDVSRRQLSYDMELYDRTTRHQLHSPLKWVDDNRLVFVDYSEQKARVVLADFSKGISQPEIQERVLDERSIIDASRTYDPRPPAAMIVPEDLSVSSTGSAVTVRLKLLDRTWNKVRVLLVEF
jgi:hypothetical protein